MQPIPTAQVSIYSGLPTGRIITLFCTTSSTQPEEEEHAFLCLLLHRFKPKNYHNGSYFCQLLLCSSSSFIKFKDLRRYFNCKGFVLSTRETLSVFSWAYLRSLWCLSWYDRAPVAEVLHEQKFCMPISQPGFPYFHKNKGWLYQSL